MPDGALENKYNFHDFDHIPGRIQKSKKKNRLALYTYKAHGVAVPCNLLLAVFTAYTFYRMAHYITFLLMVSMFFKLSKKCVVSGRYSISPGVLFTKLTGSI